jgi:hypothetical protein
MLDTNKVEWQIWESLEVKDKNNETFAIIREVENTTEKVEVILTYTDEEKKYINKWMELIFKIDDFIKKWKAINQCREYTMFIFMYKEFPERVQLYFKEIYEDLIVKNWIFKINRALKNTFSSWEVDLISIQSEIKHILSVDSTFDFESEFDNDAINDLAKNIKS